MIWLVRNKQSRNHSRKTKIAVLYTHFPHYRRAVFNAMSRSDDYSFEFFYDPRGIDQTIASGQAVANHQPRNVRMIGKRLLWQQGALSLALLGDYDRYIFLGNPFILSTWIAAILVRVRGRPVYFWTHGWLRREKGTKGLIRNTFYRLADGLMVYGERARLIGADTGFDLNRIHVIGNSLDYDVQRDAREALYAYPEADSENISSGMRLGSPYFLAVSRLVPEAGLNQAIEAMAKLPSNAVLVIVGDGPERKSLELRARELDVDARFLGAVYDEALLASLFTNARAVVSPGKVGLLAIHALGYGAPVITHDDLDRQMPEVEAIEPEMTGILFRYGDRQSLVSAMQRYFNLSDNAPERTACRAAAISRIEQDFTPEAQTAKITRALDADLKEAQ